MGASCSYVLVCLAGTYAGMTERLDYLTTLGINAIELQPIHEFNELEYYQVRCSLFFFCPSHCCWHTGLLSQIRMSRAPVTLHICTPGVRG